jgi:hypothetical protein
MCIRSARSEHEVRLGWRRGLEKILGTGSIPIGEIAIFELSNLDVDSFPEKLLCARDCFRASAIVLSEYIER